MKHLGRRFAPCGESAEQWQAVLLWNSIAGLAVFSGGQPMMLWFSIAVAN
jgi:hypothetical protein